MANGDSLVYFSFSSFGVDVCLVFDDADLLDRFKNSLNLIFKNNLSPKVRSSKDHLISVQSAGRSESFSYTFNGKEHALEAGEGRLFKVLRTLVRVTVAGNSREKLFIHAGAVSWKGKGLILPAHSNSGKTSLVIELCKLGAHYFSDEYAVLDSDGLLFPFPKHLSVRGEGGRFDQQDFDVSELGCVIANEPVPIQMVLFSQFSETQVEWSPKELSPGEGLLRLIPHIISIPIDPSYGLKMCGTAVQGVPLFEAPRGEAAAFAPQVLELLENSTFLS